MLPKQIEITARISNLLRFIVPIGVMVLCLWLLKSRVEFPEMQTMGQLVTQVSFPQWLGALSATCISFWALGRYDLVAHRHIGTGFQDRAVRGAGMASIALSQTLGFGLVTGSFARWRLLPRLQPLQAAQVTGFVAVTFMASLAAICAAGSLLLPSLTPFKWIGVLTLICLLAAAVIGFLVPKVKIGKRRLRLPSLTAMLALGIWALIDVVAAGTALWLLLPQGTGIGWAMLLPVYFLALGAAILSSAPGGVGPFELTLYALLPTENTGDLLAAIIAFRLIYFALPAVISMAVLAWPGLLKQSARQEQSHIVPVALPDDLLRSETGIIRQNGGQMMSCGHSQMAVLDSAQCSIGLFDPVASNGVVDLSWLKPHARNRNAATCVYKCSASTAVALRKSHWKILRIAEDAIVNPTCFSDTGSSYRQLRRKTRQAAKAGVEIRPAAQHLPLEQMQFVDQAWQHSHGAAQGTTMGRFSPEYLAHQQVFLAWHEQEIIGFVSFHTSDREWCLDLVRILPRAPDGTGHALIREAIDAAADQSVDRLSLAAVPDHRFAGHFDTGLRRFKSCFAPSWQPLYIAAPSWWQMAISLVELLRLIHRPPALRYDGQHINSQAAAGTLDPAHNKDEQNTIALSRSA